MNKFYLEDTNLTTLETTKRELTWKGFIHFLSLDTTEYVATVVEKGKHYQVSKFFFQSHRNGHDYIICFENGCIF